MKSLRQLLAGPTLAVASTVLLGGCVVDVSGIHLNDENPDGVEARGYFSRTVEVGSQVGLQVTALTGSVRVHGVTGATEVEVHAVRRVIANTKREAEEELRLLQVCFRPGPELFEIETVQPPHPAGSTYLVDYEISVPDHFMIRITNGNGTVTVDGSEADVHVGNGNGDVVLEDVVGSAWVSVANGSVATRIAVPLGGEVIHSVGNGSIDLVVQPTISATLSAKVGNGTISLVGLDLDGSTEGSHWLEGTLGAGDGVVDLSVGNGWIRVKGG